jgi:adenylyl-sulfate kinase
MILIQFTGLSGSGKTTLAKNVAHLLSARGYKVEVVDGDSYRNTLCKALGFSKADRYQNIRRLFDVGHDLVQSNVIVLMSAINPYEDLRNELGQYKFVKTVFLDCAIDNVIKRDPKGLYKKALLPDEDSNKIKNFTGISDAYEIPLTPDLILRTDSESESVSTEKLYSFIVSSLADTATFQANNFSNMENINHPLLHWIPNKLIEKDGQVYFEWIYLGEKRYLDPFFEETLIKCQSHSVNSKRFKVISTAENLIDWAGQLASVELKAFIFHVSRCGSTMLAQSLAVSPQNIVVAEAPIIDLILRSELFDLSKKRDLIRAVIKILGQKRFSDEKNLIIKLDSWHIFKTSELRSIFPNLPFVLLYRNPVEVLKSHSKLRGMHMVPNLLPSEIFGINNKQIEEIGFHQYGAVVLEEYFKAYSDFYEKDTNVWVYNYNEGMKSILERFLIIINADYYIEEVDQMYERLKKHSKNEKNVFTGDVYITEDLPIDVEKVNYLYKTLEEKITGQLAGRISVTL